MATLLLTQSNLSYLKKATHHWCPEIRSSHNSEAIAAGLGFTTNAALRAVMAHNAFPCLVYFDAAVYLRRLTQLGYNTFTSLLDTRFSEWPLPAWLTASRHELSRRERWYYQCEKWGIPYITVTKKRKYAELEWDCITINESAEKMIRAQDDREIVKELYSRFQILHRENPGKGFFEGSWFCGRVEGLWPSVARELAEEFLWILWRPVLKEGLLGTDSADNGEPPLLASAAHIP